MCKAESSSKGVTIKWSFIEKIIASVLAGVLTVGSLAAVASFFDNREGDRLRDQRIATIEIRLEKLDTLQSALDARQDILSEGLHRLLGILERNNGRLN